MWFESIKIRRVGLGRTLFSSQPILVSWWGQAQVEMLDLVTLWCLLGEGVPRIEHLEPKLSQGLHPLRMDWSKNSRFLFPLTIPTPNFYL